MFIDSRKIKRLEEEARNDLYAAQMMVQRALVREERGEPNPGVEQAMHERRCRSRVLQAVINLQRAYDGRHQFSVDEDLYALDGGERQEVACGS